MPTSQTVLLLKPDGNKDLTVHNLVDTLVADTRLDVVRRYQTSLDEDDVLDVWPRFAQPKYALTSILLRVYLTSGDCEVLVLAGERAVERCRHIRSVIRDRFGDSAVANCVHTASDEAEASCNVAKLLHHGEAGHRFTRPDIVDDAPGLWGRLARTPPSEIDATVRSWWRAQIADGWESVWPRIPGGPFATVLRPGDPHTIDYGVSALCEMVPDRTIGSHISGYMEAEIRGQAVVATGDQESMSTLTSQLRELGLRSECSALIPR
jgi:nucleoside diphosphate kinase